VLQFRARPATLWSRRGTGYGAGPGPIRERVGRPAGTRGRRARPAWAGLGGGRERRTGWGGLAEAGVAPGQADQRIAGFGHIGDP
jgi:hypothetical protein